MNIWESNEIMNECQEKNEGNPFCCFIDGQVREEVQNFAFPVGAKVHNNLK
jgi:hypothetical protein